MTLSSVDAARRTALALQGRRVDDPVWGAFTVAPTSRPTEPAGQSRSLSRWPDGAGRRPPATTTSWPTCAPAGLGALADLGFRGLDNDVLDPLIVTGFHASRTHKLTPGQKDANRVLAVGRAPVEHGFAHLKNWRTLTKLRTGPARATRLLRALLVLTNLEVNRSQTIYSTGSRPRPA